MQRLAAIIPIANYGQGDDGAAAAGGGGPDDDGDVPTLASLLERDLHLYLAAARGFTFDHGDVGTFTAAVLAWWKNHGPRRPGGGVGARCADHLLAHAELGGGRAHLFTDEGMFGDKRASALAECLQAAMMLRYHKRLA